MTHKEYADSLRLLADFYENHTEVPLPGSTFDNNSCFLDDKVKLAEVARALGTFKKEYGDAFIYLIKQFGAVTHRFCSLRETVCERVVVGKRTVPSSYTPEREEELVEWRCGSVLDGELAAQV